MKKAVLLADDLLGDFQNRPGPLIEAFDEPIRGLQTIEQIVFVLLGRRRLGDARVVGAIDQNARKRIAVEFDVPTAVGRGADDDIRYDGLQLDGAEFQARLRIKVLDLADHLRQFVHIDTDRLFQRADVAIGELVEIGEQLRHQRIVTVLILELQRQAFRKRAGKYPRRIERLQFAKDAFDEFERCAKSL